MINFDSLENLSYFPLLAALCAAIIWQTWRTQTAVRKLVAPKWQSLLLSGFSSPKLIFKKILLALGLVSLFLMLLHPQWGKKETSVTQEGRDLFVALDVSRSMLASDLKPDRLRVAKDKIKRLVELLKTERVGLLLFSGTAVLQCPLTQDTAAFEMFLDAVDAQTISGGTTAIDQVMSKAIEQFQNMPSKKNKLLVIFTDGEDFSQNLAELKAQAKSIGLHIFTIGVGTPQGAPVPKFDDEGHHIGFEQDSRGNVVMSRLNEGILKTVAEDTGGHYFTGLADNQELEQLAHLVQKYEKEQWQERKISKYIERYNVFALIGLLCLLLEWLL